MSDMPEPALNSFGVRQEGPCVRCQTVFMGLGNVCPDCIPAKRARDGRSLWAMPPEWHRKRTRFTTRQKFAVLREAMAHGIQRATADHAACHYCIERARLREVIREDRSRHAEWGTTRKRFSWEWRAGLPAVWDGLVFAIRSRVTKGAR